MRAACMCVCMYWNIKNKISIHNFGCLYVCMYVTRSFIKFLCKYLEIFLFNLLKLYYDCKVCMGKKVKCLIFFSLLFLFHLLYYFNNNDVEYSSVPFKHLFMGKSEEYARYQRKKWYLRKNVSLWLCILLCYQSKRPLSFIYWFTLENYYFFINFMWSFIKLIQIIFLIIYLFYVKI